MDKQIEEMAKVLCINDNFQCNTCPSLNKCFNYSHAKKLYNAGYRKIPKDAVVLTDDEYEKIYEQAEATVLSNIADGGTSCHWCMNKHEEIGYKKGSKETAEKFAERLKEDVSEDNELHEALNYYLKRDYFEYIDKICKEFVDE